MTQVEISALLWRTLPVDDYGAPYSVTTLKSTVIHTINVVELQGVGKLDEVCCVMWLLFFVCQ